MQMAFLEWTLGDKGSFIGEGNVTTTKKSGNKDGENKAKLEGRMAESGGKEV